MACGFVLRQCVIGTYIGSGYHFVLWGSCFWCVCVCVCVLLNIIINLYYHSCVFMTDIYLTIRLFYTQRG